MQGSRAGCRGGVGTAGDNREFKAHQICGLRKKRIILSFDKDSKARWTFGFIAKTRSFLVSLKELHGDFSSKISNYFCWRGNIFSTSLEGCTTQAFP